MRQRSRTYGILAGLVTLFVVEVARADTYGLPPFTAFEQEGKAQETALDGAQVLVARSAEEWSALWKKHAPKDQEAPAVNFGQRMVVGVCTPAGQQHRAIYRIELDDASQPNELVVRVAHDQAICQKPKEKTIQGARLHWVATGLSRLPIRFVQDEMVAGPLFRQNGGVEEKLLGQVPAPTTPAGKDKAATREQAEKLVRSSVTAEEIRQLKRDIWPGTFGDRYPQLWSIIDVKRDERAWHIEYDGQKFRVDVATGAVERLKRE